MRTGCPRVNTLREDSMERRVEDLPKRPHASILTKWGTKGWTKKEGNRYDKLEQLPQPHIQS